MADKTVAAEYTRLRKKYPRNPASQTILWARGNVKPTELTWDLFEGGHFAVGKGERDGFAVRAIVNYDDYASPTIGTTEEDTGIPNPDFARAWTGDSWDVRNVQRYIELESGTTLRDLVPYYRKDGDAKNVAWERARESLAEEAKGYMGEDYVQLVVTVTVSVNGVEVGEAIIGADLILDWTESTEKELDNIVSDGGLIEEAIYEARKALPTAIETAAATLAALENISQKVPQGA